MLPKIIHLLDSRNFGGLETHVSLLTDALSNQGVDAQVLFLNHYGRHPMFSELENNKISYHTLDGKILSIKTDNHTRRKNWFIELVNKNTPEDKHKEYNYAVIDYAKSICLPKPRCSICLMKTYCNYYYTQVQK